MTIQTTSISLRAFIHSPMSSAIVSTYDKKSFRVLAMLYRFFQHALISRYEKIILLLFFTITFQVSTSTGVISHFVNAQVVVPEAFILGSGELHVDMGSAINLVCIIEKVSALFSLVIIDLCVHVCHL